MISFLVYSVILRKGGAIFLVQGGGGGGGRGAFLNLGLGKLSPKMLAIWILTNYLAIFSDKDKFFYILYFLIDL